MNYIALLDLNSPYYYKILMLLHTKAYNQAELGRILEMPYQNIYKYIKTLEKENLIVIDRVEGRNKFYRAVTDINKIKAELPGQTKIKGV